MSADGTWKLTMQTPLGDRKATLALQSAGDALTGRLTGEEGNATDIYEGRLNGNSAAWKADIKSPMPLTLTFTSTVDGSTISGTVSAAVGSWPFSGTKAANMATYQLGCTYMRQGKYEQAIEKFKAKTKQ